MSTDEEKKEAIASAVEQAKRHLNKLEQLARFNKLTKAEIYEREMTIECIRRGEELLGVNHE